MLFAMRFVLVWFIWLVAYQHLMSCLMPKFLFPFKYSIARVTVFSMFHCFFVKHILFMIICLHTVLKNQVLLSNTNNLQTGCTKTGTIILSQSRSECSGNKEAHNIPRAPEHEPNNCMLFLLGYKQDHFETIKCLPVQRGKQHTRSSVRDFALESVFPRSGRSSSYHML